MRWFAMSTRFLTDPKVEQLGEQHGPIGPLVFAALLAEAGAQEKGGAVQTGFRGLAHATFSDISTVRDVVNTMLENGVCQNLSEEHVTPLSQGVTGCHVAFTGWEKYQQNLRQQESRARKRNAEKAHEKADPEDMSRQSHNQSRDVTTDRQTDNNNSSSARARDPVLAVLCDLAFQRNQSDPDPTTVSELRQHFGSLASEAEAKKFRHYYTAGPGKRRPLADVTWGWRQWLERVKEPAPAEQPKAVDRSAYASVEAAE